ncbi:hypothetical protein [Brevundimonas nasdae]|uniref:Lipoprotein n=1 Tax=Brevundimonas nasdae TaxID=172043 RepID=A0ABX8TJ31_9CAUL|nr:hypothetical protein [Brevundimonas nasdae]QYC10689.1 hypothetical protein KWG56_01325 [Brevundimonas nasdae]QYC13476.1 hypothetical protein KWG63_14880 [Brevundimonas nasdae]
MIRTSLTLLAISGLLAACGNRHEAEAPVEGPAVSTAEAPMNSAIRSDESAPANTLTPGASSFTENQARSAIEKAGYADVGPLSQDTQGVWSATGVRNGESATVSVDYKGVVTAR